MLYSLCYEATVWNYTKKIDGLVVYFIIDVHTQLVVSCPTGSAVYFFRVLFDGYNMVSVYLSALPRSMLPSLLHVLLEAQCFLRKHPFSWGRAYPNTPVNALWLVGTPNNMLRAEWIGDMSCGMCSRQTSIYLY